VTRLRRLVYLDPMRGSWIFVFVGLWVLLVAPPATADAPKMTVQVLAIMSDKGFEQAQALTIALKRAVTRAEGWSLAKGDFSLEVLSAALNCPAVPDDACLKKVESKVGAKRLVWGTLEPQGKEVVAHLRLWEDGQNKRETNLKYSANLTDASDDTLLQIAENAFAQLTGAAQGVLVVIAGNVSGEVFVDGQNMGNLAEGRTELTVPIGKREVRVVAKGYTEAVGTVNVRPGASAEITLYPRPIGGDAAPVEGDPSGKDAGGKTSTQRMLGYAGLGIGGAVVLAGGYFWIQTLINNGDDDFNDYNPQPKGTDKCEAAREPGGTFENKKIADFCDKHSRDQTLAWVLTPIGLAIAGAGAYFLLTDDSTEEQPTSRTRVQPLVGVGPRGGELRLHVTF
jgi:hypothetical protein